MATTTYTVQAANESGEFTATELTATKKESAVAKAEAYRVAQGTAVRVVTGAGTVVFEAEKPQPEPEPEPERKQRVITVHTKPFTKVLDVPEELAAMVPEGYVVAYRRPRNAAAVLRNEDPEAPKEERYAVLNEIKGVIEAFVPTTRDAGALMVALKAATK